MVRQRRIARSGRAKSTAGATAPCVWERIGASAPGPAKWQGEVNRRLDSTLRLGRIGASAPGPVQWQGEVNGRRDSTLRLGANWCVSTGSRAVAGRSQPPARQHPTFGRIGASAPDPAQWQGEVNRRLDSTLRLGRIGASTPGPVKWQGEVNGRLDSLRQRSGTGRVSLPIPAGVRWPRSFASVARVAPPQIRSKSRFERGRPLGGRQSGHPAGRAR